MSWRNYYDAEYYPLIESDLVQGYNLLEKLVEKCYEVKKTLEQRVKFDEEQIQMYYPISSYPNSSYKTVESLPTYTTENLDTIFDEYVVDKLTDYSSKMNIEYCCTSVINSNYLDEGDLEINFSNGDDIETGIKIYVDAQVTSNATYGIGNIKIDLSNSLGRISSRLNEFVTQCTTESIINFATHLNIFVDSKKETSQHTDFHDDLKVVYSSRMKKFSISSFDDLLDYEYLQTEQEYTNFMSQPVSGVNENIMTVTNNPQNIREKMVSSGSVNYECGKYIEAVKSRLREFDNYRNIVEGLSYKIELQLSAHEAEYKVNSEVKSVLDSINLDSDISLLEQLNYISDIYLSNDTYLSSKNQEILGIDEEDYLKADNCQLDEVYLEIINSYINAEITDDELINLCIEYPYLNLFIEQYYIENINTINNVDNSEKLTQLSVLNRIANDLIEEGVDEVTTIETISENRLEITVKYNADESANMQTTEENKIVIYGEFIRGTDASSVVYKNTIESEMNDNLKEINELNAKYEGIDVFATTVTFEELKSLGKSEGKDITGEMIESLFGSLPGTGTLVDVTLEEIQEYYDTQVEIEAIKSKNKELQSVLNLGEELESLKVLPSAFYSIYGEDGRDSTKFVATPKTYQLVNVIYTLDKIMDPNTSREEKYDLQMYLIQLANPDVDIYNLDDEDDLSYGDNFDDNKLNSMDFSSEGINVYISNTYSSANTNGAIDLFINGNYYKNDGTLDMDRIVEDYEQYEDMFSILEKDII